MQIESVFRLPTLREGDELCLLYTSDAADERSSADLGGRRTINKKTRHPSSSYQSNG